MANNTKRSKATEQQSYKKINTEPIVMEDKTAEILKQIEENKRKEEEKKVEMKDNYPRYQNVDITKGLTKNQVEERIKQGYTNVNDDSKGKSIFEIIISNVFTAFNILYFIIAIILIFIDIKNNEGFSNLFFLILVVTNTLIGIFQEIKSKITVDKLKILSSPHATVIRDGEQIEINVEDIVLDDIIVFKSGKQICADSIILEGNIEVNEALLTGEADSIAKTTGGELLSGSFMTSGTCIAKVERVGKDCYINKMSNDAKKYTKPRSELLSSLRKIIITISFLIIPVVVLYTLSHVNFKSFDNTGFGYWLNDFWEAINHKTGDASSVLSAVCYIVLAMIPAGLFLLTSIALFVGVIRLAKKNTLVQELYCIEMLARVDMLCLDKTGTLTDGTMMVSNVIELSKRGNYTVKEIIGSMMSSFEEKNPTSIALINHFETNTVLKPEMIIPFSSKRKFSAVSFANVGTYVIGAPDFVIQDDFASI